MSKARVFCEVKPWSGQTLYPDVSYYYWLSNTEALIVPENARGGQPVSMFRTIFRALDTQDIR